MKSKIKSLNLKAALFAVGALTVTSMAAKANNFSCVFTEPWITVIGKISRPLKVLTEQNKIMLYNGALNTKPNISKIKKTDRTDKTIKFNDVLEINFAEIGSDGMSDINFPYSAIMNFEGHQLHGGCSAELKYYENYVVRFPSYKHSLGQTLVNYWPGEYGSYVGFKVAKTVKFKKGATLSDLISNTASKKTCTLNKGKKLVPIQAKKNEVYASIDKATQYTVNKDISVSVENGFEIKKGEIITLLAYAAEGFCILEKNGKAFGWECPGNSDDGSFTEIKTEESTSPGVETDIEKGEYVYTKCSEGHSAWISNKQMSEDTVHFKSYFVQP